MNADLWPAPQEPFPPACLPVSWGGGWRKKEADCLYGWGLSDRVDSGWLLVTSCVTLCNLFLCSSFFVRCFEHDWVSGRCAETAITNKWWFFFFGHTCDTQKFPGQEWNLSHWRLRILNPLCHKGTPTVPIFMMDRVLMESWKPIPSVPTSLLSGEI